jgi:hypothetical protein
LPVNIVKAYGYVNAVIAVALVRHELVTSWTVADTALVFRAASAWRL